MLPRPPPSTLFPYATLFRSPSTPTLFIAATISSPVTCSGQFGTVDRKSTRLNSSHGYTSYAVFSLKKIIDLAASEAQIDFPVIYTNGKRGTATLDLDTFAED